MGVFDRFRAAVRTRHRQNAADRPEARGQPDDPLASYRRALEVNPRDVEALINLGNELRNRGQIDAAMASYRSALEINPNAATAHYNLAVVLREIGRLDDAITHYGQALKIDPAFTEAHLNIGNAFGELGRLEDALTSYRRASELRSSYADAHYNMANVLARLGRPAEAEASYRRTIELRPDAAEVHSNLGNTLQDLGRFDDAALSYWRAVEIDDDYAEAHFNLGSALQNLGQIDAAMAGYHRALEINPELGAAQSNLLFIHNYIADQRPEVLLAEARRFGEWAAKRARTYTVWDNVPEPDRCLRVGLVSGDLRDHPVGHFSDGVLASLSQGAGGRIALFGYPSHVCADAVADRIKASCEGWCPLVGVSDEAAAQHIRDDGIDILIDLSGHTAYNRLGLFAWKPAPVQATWLGYFATTGVEAIDYLIADLWSLPESEEQNFTEEISRLPETRLCFTAPNVKAEVTLLPALSAGYVTFGSFNHISKINNDVIAVWARVLATVPGSRLLLKAKQITEASVRQQVIQRFAAQGVDTERLILEGPGSRAEYLASFPRVDIVLDTFPYPGGTTTVEALWMGIPVLTMAGDRFLSRQGVGLLMNAGLREWVATGPEDYVNRAALLAGDLPALAELRHGLREQVLKSPIFDTRRFAAHFEIALREMWRRWCLLQETASPDRR
jgi:predicted O-linked N-acetylglucosamine transferase (SPINDLY family)